MTFLDFFNQSDFFDYDTDFYLTIDGEPFSLDKLTWHELSFKPYIYGFVFKGFFICRDGMTLSIFLTNPL